MLALKARATHAGCKTSEVVKAETFGAQFGEDVRIPAECCAFGLDTWTPRLDFRDPLVRRRRNGRVFRGEILRYHRTWLRNVAVLFERIGLPTCPPEKTFMDLIPATGRENAAPRVAHPTSCLPFAIVQTIPLLPAPDQTTLGDRHPSDVKCPRERLPFQGIGSNRCTIGSSGRRTDIRM